MHNGRFGVIGFKVFECGGWVDDRVLAPTSPLQNEVLGHPSDKRGLRPRHYVLTYHVVPQKTESPFINSSTAFSKLPLSAYLHPVS